MYDLSLSFVQCQTDTEMHLTFSNIGSDNKNCLKQWLVWHSYTMSSVTVAFWMPLAVEHNVVSKTSSHLKGIVSHFGKDADLFSCREFHDEKTDTILMSVKYEAAASGHLAQHKERNQLAWGLVITVRSQRLNHLLTHNVSFLHCWLSKWTERGQMFPPHFQSLC